MTQPQQPGPTPTPTPQITYPQGPPENLQPFPMYPEVAPNPDGTYQVPQYPPYIPESQFDTSQGMPRSTLDGTMAPPATILCAGRRVIRVSCRRTGRRTTCKTRATLACGGPTSARHRPAKPTRPHTTAATTRSLIKTVLEQASSM